MNPQLKTTYMFSFVTLASFLAWLSKLSLWNENDHSVKRRQTKLRVIHK